MSSDFSSSSPRRALPVSRARIGLAALGALALAGCASEGHYPSLERRPVEDSMRPVTGTPEPRPAPPPATESLTQELARLVSDAQTMHKRFEGDRPEAERTTNAATNATVASPGWFAANAAIARLDDARGELALTLAELDRLYLDDRMDNAIPDALAGRAEERPTGEAISNARETVLVLAQEEDAVLEALRAKLPGGAPVEAKE